jgi:hypothetical protein
MDLHATLATFDREIERLVAQSDEIQRTAEIQLTALQFTIQSLQRIKDSIILQYAEPAPPSDPHEDDNEGDSE